MTPKTEPNTATMSTGRMSDAWLFSICVFITSLAFYVTTMSHTVFWWDSGELAANARVLGIAHRPGFPLYILLGHVFGMFPFGEYFYRINFLSALSAAATLGLVGFVWWQLVFGRLRPSSLLEGLIPVSLALIAIGGTYTFWIQAVRTEVYAANIVAIAMLWGCTWQSDRGESGDSSGVRWFWAASLVGGLGMALHHATFASVLPAFFLFFLVVSKRNQWGRNAWVIATALFALGLSVYLYLPIRALQDPELNWGWTRGAKALGWTAVAGTDAYAELAKTSLAALLSRAWAVSQIMIEQLHWGLLLFAIAGIWQWWRKARAWMLMALGIVITNIFVTALLVSEVAETNADIHGYLLPTIVSMAFLVCGGVYTFGRLLASVAKRYLPSPSIRTVLWVSTITMVLLLALAPGIIYSPYCNLSHNRLAHDLGVESISGLRPNGIVFLAGTNWDFVLRGLRYVDGWRPDLTVINRDLLPAGWYRSWLLSKHPELAAYPIPSDSIKLRPKLWAKNLAAAGFPIYWEFTEIDMDMVGQLVPAGHLFELAAKPVDVLGTSLLDEQENFERNSQFYAAAARVPYDYDAKMVWVMNLYRAGMYYESRGLLGRAKELYQRALSVAPMDETVLAAYVRVAPDRGFAFILRQDLTDPAKQGNVLPTP
ncbi:MAG: DUF2723 domain-containing protein [candidate division Zixibacteria bacterium]|nr:DUF2723 domain-containing protein [candidate division Zixibacteria bacterium]